MTLELAITGGRVVSPGGIVDADIGVRQGRIAVIAERGALPPSAHTIDANGLTVMPGLVDMHSHHREPGFEHKEDIRSATSACAAGGVTTTVAMPNVYPPPNKVEILESMMDLYRKSAIVDWNINPAGTIVDELESMAKLGVSAMKVFMVTDTGRDYPHMPGIGVHEHGKLLAIMEECARLDVPLMVHPHDQSLMDHIEQQFWARGERDALAYAKAYAAHDGLIWESAIGTLLRMQRATGVQLHLLHVQTAGSVDMIREAKRRGQRISAEVNPWALFLGHDWANIERLGSYALSYWVPSRNIEPLWEGLADGTIDIISTDHAPHTREEKEVGWEDGWAAQTGTPSAQFYLRMLLDSVAKGRLSLERVAELAATAPATIFDLNSKGQISVGRDADLVLVDTERTSTISDDEVLSTIGYTPYAGLTLVGLPVRTLVRGKTVFADNAVVGDPGYGEFAPRTPSGSRVRAGQGGEE